MEDYLSLKKQRELLWQSFLEKEISKLSKASQWLRKMPRSYKHFDDFIDLRSPDTGTFFKNNLSTPLLVQQLQFFPFIRHDISIPKFTRKNGKRVKEKNKVRPICYAAHKDALIYAFYSKLLYWFYNNVLQQEWISECVIAYRENSEKCNIEYANEVFAFIKNTGECLCLCYDIKKFYDTLDHLYLKKMRQSVLNLDYLPSDHLNLYKSLTKFRYVFRKDILKFFWFSHSSLKRVKNFCEKLPVEFWFGNTPRNIDFHSLFRRKLDVIKRTKQWEKFVRKNELEEQEDPNNVYRSIWRRIFPYGIPQWSPISWTLSNIYMIDFDKQVQNKVSWLKWLYRRYCDDIIIVLPDVHDKEKIEDFIVNILEKEMRLRISDNKKEVIEFKIDSHWDLRWFDFMEKDKNKYLQYLWFEFNWQNAYIRSSSLSRFYRRIHKKISNLVRYAYSAKWTWDTLYKRKLLYQNTNLHDRYSKRINQKDKTKWNFTTYWNRAIKWLTVNNKQKYIKNQLEKHVKVIKEMVKKQSDKQRRKRLLRRIYSPLK